MKIEVLRNKKHKFGIFRKMEVFVDGKKLSTLKVGEKVELDIQNSKTIWVKMDWCRSEKLYLTDDSTNKFICGEEKLLWATFATFFYPVGALSLNEVDDLSNT
jgi:hypothetical protein